MILLHSRFLTVPTQEKLNPRQIGTHWVYAVFHLIITLGIRHVIMVYYRNMLLFRWIKFID
jgi:hypothetical protein